MRLGHAMSAVLVLLLLFAGCIAEAQTLFNARPPSATAQGVPALHLQDGRQVELGSMLSLPGSSNIKAPMPTGAYTTATGRQFVVGAEGIAHETVALRDGTVAEIGGGTLAFVEPNGARRPAPVGRYVTRDGRSLTVQSNGFATEQLALQDGRQAEIDGNVLVLVGPSGRNGPAGPGRYATPSGRIFIVSPASVAQEHVVLQDGRRADVDALGLLLTAPNRARVLAPPGEYVLESGEKLTVALLGVLDKPMRSSALPALRSQASAQQQPRIELQPQPQLRRPPPEPQAQSQPPSHSPQPSLPPQAQPRPATVQPQVQPQPQPSMQSQQKQAPGSPLPQTSQAQSSNSSTILPAEHKLFSSQVAAALRTLQAMQAGPRPNLAVPAKLAKRRAAVFSAAGQTVGILECDGRSKPTDAVALEDAGERLVVSFSCQLALLRRHGRDRGQPGAQTLSIAYQKAAIPTLFRAETGVTLHPLLGLGRPPMTEILKPASQRARIMPIHRSKDDLALEKCLDAFHRYKSNPKLNLFHIVFFERVYHCEVAPSREAYVAHAQFLRSHNPFSPSVNGISPASAPALAALRIDVNPDAHGLQTYGFSPYTAIQYESQPNPNQKPQGPGLDLGGGEPGILFAFGARQQLPWPKAMLQIKDNTQPFPSSSSTKPMLKLPEDPCANWQAPLGLQAKREVPIRYDAQEGNRKFAAPFDKTKFAGVVMLPLADLVDAAKKAIKSPGDTSYHFVRLVPLGPDGRCAAAPSSWVSVQMHDKYPEEKKQFDENQHKLAMAGADGKRGSPITVAVTAFAPYNLDAGDAYGPLLVTSPISGDALSAWGIKTGPWANCVFEPEHVAGWPHEDHSDLESWFERAWDDFIAIVDDYLMIWNSMKDVVAELVVSGLSAGKCPIDDPSGSTPPAAGESDACKDAKAVVAFAAQVALASAGGAGNAQTASQLTQEEGETLGNEAAAEMEQQSSGYLQQHLPDLGSEFANQAALYGMQKATEYLINKLVSGVSHAVLSSINCTDPDASAALIRYRSISDPLLNNTLAIPAGMAQMNDATKNDPAARAALQKYMPGSYGFNAQQCIVATSNPATWGIWNPYRLPSPGIFFVQVAKNQNPTPAFQKLVGFKENQQISVTVHDASGWFNDGAVLLDVKRIPQQGLLVPITLSPNYYKFLNEVDRQSAFYMDDAEARWFVHKSSDKGPAAEIDLQVTSRYVWTDQPTLTPNNEWVDVVWAEHRGSISDKMGTLPHRSDFQPPEPPECRFCDKGGHDACH